MVAATALADCDLCFRQEIHVHPQLTQPKFIAILDDSRLVGCQREAVDESAIRAAQIFDLEAQARSTNDRVMPRNAFFESAVRFKIDLGRTTGGDTLAAKGDLRLRAGG